MAPARPQRTTPEVPTDDRLDRIDLSREPEPPARRSGVGWAWLVTLAIAFFAGVLIDGGIGPAPRSASSGASPARPTATTVAPGGTASAPGGTASPSGGSVSPSGGSAAPVPSSSAAAGESPVPTAAPTATPEVSLPPLGTLGPNADETVPPFAPEDFALFWQALQLAQENYVNREALDPRNLTYGAINGMIEALGDTGHTVFLTPEQVRSEQAALSGEVIGIGALLGERNGLPAIVSVIRGAPAERAGLRSGDLLVSVDGESVEGVEIPEIGSRIRGRAGTSVTIEVLRPATEQQLEFTIVRELIEVPAVGSAFVPGTRVLVVRLSQFSEGAAAEVTGALEEGLAEGAEAVILDMRGNPGGFVNEAIGVASQFLAEGVVFQTQNAAGARNPVPVLPGGIATDVPLVVLVDTGSASSAEITAGGIQDAGRAPLIGTPTAGTGTVLNTFPLDDGSAVRIGVEQWLTPSGTRIFGEGLTPDQEVDLPPESLPLLPEEFAEAGIEGIVASGDEPLLVALERLGVEVLRTPVGSPGTGVSPAPSGQ